MKTEKIVYDKSARLAIKFMYVTGEPSMKYEVVEIVSFCGEPDNPEDVKYCNEEDTFEQSEKMCTGYIKWDGCMEIHNMNYHMCYWGNHLQCMIDTIYKQAIQIMGDSYCGCTEAIMQ